MARIAPSARSLREGVVPRGRRRGPACAGGGRLAAGFTLLEILVVLALLVIMVGFAWPMMAKQITAAHLPESANHIRDMLFMARAEAVLEHRRVRVRFAPDEQQPNIEYEPDSILRPGQWEPVLSAWARAPMLLADIQVHDVLPGRPVYLEALSFDSDPDEQEAESLEELEAAAEFDASAASSGMDSEDGEIDEMRPPIIFEADGSTEWATIIVAKLPLEEGLEEEHEQLWVILDGRTGLAEVREQVTEAQLSDEDFYVQREKLEIPLDTDIANLSMGGGSQGVGGLFGAGLSAGGSGFGGSGGQSAVNGLSELADLAGAAADGTDLQGLMDGLPATDSGLGEGADNRDGPRDLEEALLDSDLTDEERENIRRTLGGRQGGGRRGDGRRGGGRRGDGRQGGGRGDGRQDDG